MTHAFQAEGTMSRRSSDPTLIELQRLGATLVRQGRHLVYRLPNGKTFILSRSSSDRNQQNERTTIRRLMRDVPA